MLNHALAHVARDFNREATNAIFRPQVKLTRVQTE